jgi:hypothetical protein
VSNDQQSFRDAIRGLKAGDFSRLEPLFEHDSPGEGVRCQIIQWHEAGLFDNEAEALDEALTCACFLGHTSVAKYLLDHGVNPAEGFATGLNAFHWAVNRGQLGTTKLLIEHRAPLEIRNMYGGNVLGTAVWSVINEPRGEQLLVIEELLKAGARIEDAEYPTGDERVDEVLKRYGAAQ